MVSTWLINANVLLNNLLHAEHKENWVFFYTPALSKLVAILEPKTSFQRVSPIIFEYFLQFDTGSLRHFLEISSRWQQMLTLESKICAFGLIYKMSNPNRKSGLEPLHKAVPLAQR